MALTATEARANLFGLIEQVNEDAAPVHISSKRGDAVLISRDEYEAMEETASQSLCGMLSLARGRGGSPESTGWCTSSRATTSSFFKRATTTSRGLFRLAVRHRA